MPFELSKTANETKLKRTEPTHIRKQKCENILFTKTQIHGFASVMTNFSGILANSIPSKYLPISIHDFKFNLEFSENYNLLKILNWLRGRDFGQRNVILVDKFTAIRFEIRFDLKV